MRALFFLFVLWFPALFVPHSHAQTLPLTPGGGFGWEQVGNEPQPSYYDLAFDAGGTLWTADDARWLDPATDTWVEPSRWGRTFLLPLGPHPDGGSARADTIVAIGQRTTDGGETWTNYDDPEGHPIGRTLAEIPAGFPHSGRILIGQARGYSDDRGITWTPAQDTDGAALIGGDHIAVLPPSHLLPGATSGRDPAAPAGWPAARVVAGGDGGVNLSDDSGETYHATTWGGGIFGYYALGLAVVRRPDTHPLGPGPRVLMTARIAGFFDLQLWSSDDAGQSWTQRSVLPENESGPGGGRAEIFALSEPGESDPGAGGRAVVGMGYGHIYQTTDGGDTWQLLGRAPAMRRRDPQDPDGYSAWANAWAVGPDGRLYVGVVGGRDEWVYRTMSPVVVAEEAVPSERGAVGVTVSPNPSAGGAVTVDLTLAARSASVRVEVFDAVGRRVASLFEGVAREALSLNLDTSALAAGTYRVVVMTDGAHASRAFTVAR